MKSINLDIPAISINNYTKIFKKFIATKKVSFDVGHGTIHGFIGPNGSGKTTCIKGMIGAYTSKKNQILINGHIAGSKDANNLIGYIPERASFPKHLNCIQYLSTMGELSGLKSKVAKEKAVQILKDLNLKKHSNRKPISFSSGMQKKILLAQALIIDPDILILDEPAANLDPTARKDLFQELIKLRNDGKTILLSSHVLAELERIIDEVTFIFEGNIIYSGLISNMGSKESDVFIKTDNNILAHKFIKEKFKQFIIKGDIKTEIIVKDVSRIDARHIFESISKNTKLNIKSIRTNDLQSIYDKLTGVAKKRLDSESKLLIKGDKK